MPSASRSSAAVSVSASQLIKLEKSVTSLVLKKKKKRKVTAIICVFHEKRRLEIEMSACGFDCFSSPVVINFGLNNRFGCSFSKGHEDYFKCKQLEEKMKSNKSLFDFNSKSVSDVVRRGKLIQEFILDSTL